MSNMVAKRGTAGETHIDEAQKDRIAEAVRDVDLTGFACWNDLDVLSLRTVPEDIEVLDDAIDINGKIFSGVLNVYVLLEYGKGEEGFTSSDGFPGKFKGHFDENDQLVIDEVTVDTSSFYA